MSGDLLKIPPSFHGMSLVPKKFWKDYGHALLIIAGADGEVSDPEMDWLTKDLAQHFNVSEELIQEWEYFEFEKAKLKDIFARIHVSSAASFNRLLIYDAIRMCRADDDYHDAEREKIAEAARLLKVSQDTVLAIEAIVDLEKAAEKLRSTLL